MKGPNHNPSAHGYWPTRKEGKGKRVREGIWAKIIGPRKGLGKLKGYNKKTRKTSKWARDGRPRKKCRERGEIPAVLV